MVEPFIRSYQEGGITVPWYRVRGIGGSRPGPGDPPSNFEFRQMYSRPTYSVSEGRSFTPWLLVCLVAWVLGSILYAGLHQRFLGWLVGGPGLVAAAIYCYVDMHKRYRRGHILAAVFCFLGLLCMANYT